MKSIIAHLATGLLSALLLSAAPGCASSDDAASGESDVVANTPARVRDAAQLLRLGELQSSSEAHLRGLYEFERGSLAYSFIFGQVDSARVVDPNPEVGTVQLSGELLRTALGLEAGAITGVQQHDGAKLDVKFEHATVHLLAPVDDPNPKVESVTWPGVGVLEGEALLAATSLELGKFQSKGPAHVFDRGRVRVVETGALREVTVTDPSVESKAPPILSREVVLTAGLPAPGRPAFGRLVKMTLEPGHQDFEFELGTIVMNEHGPMEIYPKVSWQP